MYRFTSKKRKSNYPSFRTFYFNSNENLTEQTLTEEIRIINASVELRFNEANEDTFNLGENYSINGTIFGDEGEQPTGSIELKYGNSVIGQTEITGNQGWSINFLVPSNSSWGNTILTARFSGNEIYPEDIVVKNIIKTKIFKNLINIIKFRNT